MNSLAIPKVVKIHSLPKINVKDSHQSIKQLQRYFSLTNQPSDRDSPYAASMAKNNQESMESSTQIIILVF